MQLEGQGVKRARWIHTDLCVVRVEVEAVIPRDDPSEPCYEPATVEFLREVHEHAEANDVDWLQRVGQVYVRVPT